MNGKAAGTKTKRRSGLRYGLLLFFAGAALSFLLFAHPFLAVTQRVDADHLVIEGWIPDYMLSTAAKEFHEGKYALLLVSGLQNSPEETEAGAVPDATRTAARLEELGVPKNSIIACRAPFAKWLRTSKTARAVHEKMVDLRLSSRGINVITAGPHARETWVAYQHAFGDQTPVGIISIPKNNYPADRWWLSRQGLIWVPKDFIAWLKEVVFGLRS